MTDKFVESINSIKKIDIPGSTYDKAKLCLLDYLACALAGSRIYSSKEKNYINSLFPETGNSTVLGLGLKTTMQTAALINGISAHAVELDDGHRIGMMHPGAPVISAVLAVAEKEHLLFEDLLYGIIIGYEVAIRLACATQPGCKLKGFHATGICGTIGGAMGIAAALGFSESQMKSALASAITSASGVLEMIEGDSEMKPVNAGNAAMSAVSSAFIGRAGFKSPKDPLGGKRGFLKVFGDDIKTEYLLRQKDDPYCIESIYNKPYASCRHTHPALEAAMTIRKRPGFKIENVESIQVVTYKLAVAGHDHTNIEGVNSAKMSIPYSVAVALFTGKAGLDEFSEEMVRHPSVLKLTNKVKVTDNDEFTALSPGKRVAEVIVEASGESFRERVDYPKGEPENPLSTDEFVQKFKGLMSFAGYSDKESADCLEYVEREKFNIKELIGLL